MTKRLDIPGLERVSVVFCGISLTLMALVIGYISTPTVAEDTTIFIEDFEGTWPGPWSVEDNDPSDGYDYWGVSTYRSFSGSRSAWCAQIGYNSVDLVDNSVSHHYDNNMDAIMEVGLGDTTGYESLSLTFRYMGESESGYDDLSVVIFDGSWSTLWAFDGSQSTWQEVSSSVPVGTTKLVFYFGSDSSVRDYEGFYIDDIVLVGSASPPTSEVQSLSAYQRSQIFSVNYVASDPESGVKYVELYYRHDGGTWRKYTSTANPNGLWSGSPISFDTSDTGGDGQYEFYTIATDNANKVEDPPGSPDATTIVDTQSPSTNPDDYPTYSRDRSFEISVQVEETNTIDYIELYYRVDDGSWRLFESLSQSPWVFSFDATKDGIYDFYTIGEDVAGNVEQIPAGFDCTVVVDSENPTLSFTSPSPGSLLTKSSVTVTWIGSDSLSGLDYYEIQLDSGQWTQKGLDEAHVFKVTDGDHVVRVRAYDKAGNVRTSVLDFTADTNPLSPSGPYGGLPLYIIVALIIIVVIIFAARRIVKKAPRQPPMERSPGIQPTEAASPSEPSGQLPVEPRICPSCGAKSAGQFCQNCGSLIEP